MTSEWPDEPESIAVERQRRLLSVLACPSCSAPVRPVNATWVGGAVVDAELECASCGAVGVIRSYRASFHPEDLGDGWGPAGMAEAKLDIAASAIGSGWTEHEGGAISTAVGDCLTGETSAAGLVVDLDDWPWGGAAYLTLGDVEQFVELHADERRRRRHRLLDGRTGPRRWTVTNSPTGDRSKHGHQVLVMSVAELVPASDAPPLRFAPANRGNPYPDRLQPILDSLPPDAMAIDIGGGDRCHPDPRLLNFEYLRFDHADFFGDGLHLPIASDSVDFIHSQAVLEHVPEPQRAVDELRRVLKPGGRLYAEFAFMQPLHAVPFHFFNITPHGAALLFADWDTVDSGVFGGLSATVEWFFRVVGADSKLSSDDRHSVLATLQRLDEQLSRRELEHIASAVYVEALKRGVDI